MESEWKSPDRLPPLVAGEVQIWRMGLEEEMLHAAYDLLNAEERERAARMRAGLPRYEFVVGRGALRLLLGSALGVKPGDLRLAVGEHGKLGLDRLFFNVAHSNGVVLVALTLDGAVGVDVEAVNAEVEVLEIARTAFHPEDRAQIEQAGDDGVREFFRLWTWKEAVAKADGRGLTLDPATFAAGSGGEGECEVSLPGAGLYYVRRIEAGSGHMAALAAARPTLIARQYELSVRHFA